MTQEQQPEQRNFVKESLEQLTQEDLNQCINALLQNDPLIASKFDNIRFQIVITKQANLRSPFPRRAHPIQTVH
jgi:hypothetical protein